MAAISQLGSPYPGLRPFHKSEWSIFFGREQMIDSVIDKLAERQLVFVHGSSGCGKSSLIRAGVLPRLEQEYSRHGVVWRTATMRPGNSPLWSLAYAIARIVEGIDDDAEPNLEIVRIIRKLLNSGVEALPLIQHRFELGRSCNVCILFDQFEELFRYAREIGHEEAEILIEILKGFALEEKSRKLPLQGIHAIVTMRSDHLGDCAHFIGFAELVNDTQYLLPRISDEGLIRAIREPARLFGGDVEATLIIRLVEESRNEVDALPLVQHALMRLWQKASLGQATTPFPPRRQDEDSLGTSRMNSPVIGTTEYQGLQRLLSDHADEVLKELRDDNPELELIAQYVFRALCEIDAEGRGIRRPQRFDELVAIIGGSREKLDKVVHRFSKADCGFLFRATGDNPVIDISHEALLRCWKKLNDQSIDSLTGLPKGWIYREKADGDRWRAALIVIDRFEARIFLKERDFSSVIKWLSRWSTRFTLWTMEKVSFGYLRVPRLSLAFDDEWFEQLPGEGWAQRYGGRWHDVHSEMLSRQRTEAFGIYVMLIGYPLLALWLYFL